MKRGYRVFCIVVALALMAGAAMPQVRTKQGDKTQSPNSTASRVATPAGTAATSTPVTGSGTAGQLVKWAGSDTSGSFSIGNSVITETKTGSIGIGTTTPGSTLTVQGMIETTLGGFKFPDGTIQSTATSVVHDTTLKGDGSASTPLGLASPLILNGTTPGSRLAVQGIIESTTGGFKYPDGTIKTTAFVKHDFSLTGDGANTPLAVAAPLFLSGAVGNEAQGVLNVENTEPGITNGIVAHGGKASTFHGGAGIVTFGGESSASAAGGVGLFSVGADASAAGINGNSGSISQGGDAANGTGGTGIILLGGTATGKGHKGGTALDARSGTGLDGATDGLAGDFSGNVAISGNLSKGGGSFKIDHPLDPENKYLYHSFVESPDMMNIYNGTVTTDGSGEATVTLPDWFEALNQDFRYQLTVIGTFAQAIVGQEIKGNSFIVKTNAPNIKVSWQVTGIRHDAYANKHRIPVEEQKPEDERGLFLHPDAFNQPAEKGVHFVQAGRHSESLSSIRARVKQQSQQQ